MRQEVLTCIRQMPGVCLCDWLLTGLWPVVNYCSGLDLFLSIIIFVGIYT